jgi:hypothetical protein
MSETIDCSHSAIPRYLSHGCTASNGYGARSIAMHQVETLTLTKSDLRASDEMGAKTDSEDGLHEMSVPILASI